MKTLWTAIGASFSFLLLAFYLLPHTPLYALSPWAHFQMARTGTADRVSLYAGAAACSAIVLITIGAGINFKGSRVLVGTIGIYVCALAVSVMTQGDNIGIANDCLSILLALTTGAVAALVVPDADARVTVVTLLAAIQSIWALWLQHNGENFTQSGDIMRAGGTFDSPNHLFTLSAVVLPMAIAAGAGTKSVWRFAWLSGAVALVFASLVCTWSRGGFIAASAGCLVIARKLTLSHPKSLVPIVLALVVFTSVPFVVRTRGATNAASTRRSDAGRGFLVGRALDAWKRSPILGSGIGSVRIDIDWPSDLARDRPKTESLVDPRSVALLWLMEMGIPGAVLFLGLCVGVGILVRASQTPAEIALCGGIVSLTVSGIADVTFGGAGHNPGNALLGYLAASAALALFGRVVRSAHVQGPDNERVEQVTSHVTTGPQQEYSSSSNTAVT